MENCFGQRLVKEKGNMMLGMIFRGWLVLLTAFLTVNVTANDLVQVSAVGTYEYKSSIIAKPLLISRGFVVFDPSRLRSKSSEWQK